MSDSLDSRKEKSKKWRNKMGRRVECGGVHFESLAEAAKYYNTTKYFIKKCIEYRRPIPCHNAIPNYVQILPNVEIEKSDDN